MQNRLSIDSFHIYSLSEQAVTVEFGKMIDEDVLARVNNFNSLVNQNPFPGFITTVPAYTTVTVFYDALQVGQSATMPGGDCFEKVSSWLYSLKDKKPESSKSLNETITIPVCYGSQFGPDLEDVATIHKLTPQKVIELHSAATYKVYMIGFVPGFAYLGGMNEDIAMPRKQTPRSAIPAGSVGIAGKQTGVYPLETPGGWQIIGRTPLKMFDVRSSQPSLLKAGDNVVFKPISEQEYNDLLNS
jgi:inhibitor of KinA